VCGELLGQRNTLRRLTRTEEMTAQVRRTPATSADAERELARDAQICRDCGELLRELIPVLDGVYDVVATAVGRLGAAAKAQLEQGSTLPEALVTDLTLERQLLDRARFTQRLGAAAQQPRVIEVMERLEAAHTATVEWLQSSLADLAPGQPAKLRPTTAQSRDGGSPASPPARPSTGSTARWPRSARRSTASGTPRATCPTARNADGAVGRLQRLDRDTNQVLTAGRDAALNRAEEVPREDGDDRVAEVVHETRPSLRVLRVEELPIPGYDTLNVGMASHPIEELADVPDIEVVLTYERAHKGRAGVTWAAEARISEQSPPVHVSDAPFDGVT